MCWSSYKLCLKCDCVTCSEEPQLSGIAQTNCRSFASLSSIWRKVPFKWHIVNVHRPHTICYRRPYIHWFGSSFRYKDLPLSLHPSQTPCLPLPQSQKHPTIVSLATPTEKDTMVNFNNTSSSSSSNVAKPRQPLCVWMCVYLLRIVCEAYGLLTSQAQGH